MIKEVKIHHKQKLLIGIIAYLFLCLILAVAIHFVHKPQILTQKAQGTGIDGTNSIWTDPKTLQSLNILPQPSQIIEVTLHPIGGEKTSFVITAMTKISGFAPKMGNEINGYLMTIEDASGNVLAKQQFVIPRTIGGFSTNSNPDFTVILPWDQQAATVKIYDRLNTLLVEKPISSLSQNHTALATPVVHSIVGSMLTKQIATQIDTTHAPLYNTLHAAQSSSGHINIVIINQQYNGDLTLYHNDAQSIIQNFLGYEPYHARASQILFHVLDTTQDFNCTPTPSPEGTYYLCDNNAVIQAVNAAGVPYDAITVLLDNSSERITGVASFNQHIGVMVNYHNNTFFATPQDTLNHLGELFAHEIGGHAFAGLADTYVYRDWNSNYYNSSSGVQGTTPRPGCSADANPAAWHGVINSYDINSGCTYSDWYRSSNTNIMNGNSEYYDSVQQQAINQKMDQIAGPFSDTVPPTCSINAPGNGFQFSEQDVGYWDNVYATANDNYGVTRMDLYVDDKPVYTFYYEQTQVKADGSNYWFNLPTDTPIGTHKVYVKAYDENGNICTSPSLSYSIVSGPAQNNDSPTPSQSQQPTLTPITTPTPSTAVITPGQSTSFSITVCPHGIGNCGDNRNPSGQGTLSPKHTSRSVSVALYNNSNIRVSVGTGNIQYNTSAGNFQGIVPVRSLPSGQYIAVVTMQGYLSKTVPGILSVTQGQTVTIPALSVTAGDINDNNQLDIINYNLLISCFGSKQNSATCTTPPTANYFGSDINDDGAVGSPDYNLFLRELSTQKGA